MPKSRPGELNCKAKLTADQVREIRRSQESQTLLASRFGVSVDTIWNIRSRKTWRHIDDSEDIPDVAETEDEHWRPVVWPGYNGLYEVSDLGRIRRAWGGDHLPNPVRRLFRNRVGYVLVRMTRDGEQADAFVHVLACAAFLGPKKPSQQVNHKSGDKEDNRLENLEYVTAQENVQHASAMRLMPFGERNCKAKLTDDAVRRIRVDKRPAHLIALEHGVHKETILRTRRGVAWPHVTNSLE